MKKFSNSSKPFIVAAIVAAIMFLTSVSMFAEVTRTGNTFKVEQTSQQDTLTSYNWQDKDGVSYPIYVTKKGACYIKRVSKNSGKEYKYYLPKEVQEQIKKELGLE